MSRYDCYVTLLGNSYHSIILASNIDEAARKFARRMDCPVQLVDVRYHRTRRPRKLPETDKEN